MSFQLALLALSAILVSVIACEEFEPTFTEQARPTATLSEISPTATSNPPSIPTPESTPLPTSTDLDPTLKATVVRIIDGDAVEVIIGGNQREIVRLAGVDTPEIFSPNRAGEYGDIADTDCLDLWATKAIQFTAQTLRGKSIVLVVNQPDQRDSYERLLGDLIIDGENFNSLLIEKGYARVLEEHESTKKDAYLALQSSAMSEGRGLWACGSSKDDSLVKTRFEEVPAL